MIVDCIFGTKPVMSRGDATIAAGGLRITVKWTLARNRLDACNVGQYLANEKNTPAVVTERTGKRRPTNISLFFGDGIHA